MTQGLTTLAKQLLLEGKLKIAEVKEVSVLDDEGLPTWPEAIAGRIHYDSIEIDPNGNTLIVYFRQEGMPIYKVAVTLTGGTVTIKDLDGYLEVTLRDD